ncbi:MULTISPECIES: PadR family transcriptional regulator [Bacillus cereus group]|uniref:PadR family transcriptional regulator n=1 Tax=Bacillus cereus group TaxID=86661 RepID=UPI000CD8C0DD|nr:MULTISPECIES: PadR family transcriptional regulator [Bacillus cereus group]UOB98929.1 hypothetical protein BTI679_63300 [Bacillus wiedmannii]
MEKLTNDKWINQLKKGVFELTLLSLIKKESMYGYELTNSLKDYKFMNLANGAIYPILKRLTQNEWITYHWIESAEGPKRKYYQITKKGEKILKERWSDYQKIYKELEEIIREEQ